MIWGSLFLSLIIVTAAGFYTYFIARPMYDPTVQTYKTLEITSYVLWGIAALILFSVMCCFNAIQIGIAVFQTTCDYVRANMHVFLLPAIASVCQVLFSAIWLSAAIFIFSVGAPEPRENYPFVTEVKWTTETRIIMFYFVFGFFWINAFIIGSTQYVIGASTCIWYFTVDTDSKGRNTVRKGIWWLCRYNAFSIALGSMIIAICQMIRFLFEYYRKYVEKLPIG
jgi:hypothetical protein